MPARASTLSLSRAVFSPRVAPASPAVGAEEDGGAGGAGGKNAEDALLEAITTARAAGVAGLGTGTRADQAGKLLPGDRVVVVRGDLQGLSGRVVVVNGSTFTLQPSAESSAALGLTERCVACGGWAAT
jgi:hypothetical protein